MKKFWVILNESKVGPLSLKELKTHNISENTKIWYEGLEDWTELRNSPIFEKFNKEGGSEVESRKSNKSYLLKGLLVTVIIILLAIIGYFLYDRYRYSEDMARRDAQRFFNLISVNSIDYSKVAEIYPEFTKIGNFVSLKNNIAINNISKNSQGNFEVFATAFDRYPIYIEISKVGSKVEIISSTGLSYSFYNHLREYGIALGCLSGNENDVMLGEIIESKKIETYFDFQKALAVDNYKRNIKIQNNLTQDGGYYTQSYLSGRVTIINNNDIFLDGYSLSGNIEVFNRAGKIILTEKLWFFGTASAYSTLPSNYIIFMLPSNASKYEVSYEINPSEQVKEALINNIIQNSSGSCDL